MVAPGTAAGAWETQTASSTDAAADDEAGGLPAERARCARRSWLPKVFLCIFMAVWTLCWLIALGVIVLLLMLGWVQT